MNTPTTDVIIGVDVGTTAVKVAAFAVNGAAAELPKALREYPLEQPQPGWQVQEPTTVLSAIDSAIADCVAQLRDAEVLAISLSTAMHGLIGLDAQYRPLTPLVTWADSRGHLEARELRKQGLARVLLHRTGTPAHPMSPLVKLIWFSRHEPRLMGQARWWAGLKDYVLHHLTGELVTELSSASATGLLDLKTREWDAQSLDLAGIEADQLPPVLPTTTVLKLSEEAGQRIGLPGSLPVAVGAADGPLGNLGTGAIVPGVAGLSLGTSGAVRMAVPEPSFDAEGRLFCYALTDDLWVIGGAISNGGITLRWAGETFAPDLVAEGHADVDVLKLAAQAPPGSDGLLMLPYVLSERAPLWDPDLSGAFLGIRAHHTRSHFIRAALEGVCLQLSDNRGLFGHGRSCGIYPCDGRPLPLRAVASSDGGHARAADVGSGRGRWYGVRGSCPWLVCARRSPDPHRSACCRWWIRPGPERCDRGRDAVRCRRLCPAAGERAIADP